MSDYDWPPEHLKVRGNVGIGIDTEIPSRKLEVIGDISATNLNLSGTANAAQLFGDGSNLTGLVTTTGNSTIDGSLTINQNLTVSGNFQLGTLSINEFSSDGNLADNSNLAIPTEQAVKTYVDNQISQVNNTLDTKAALNGAANQDFTAQNLTVGANLRVSGDLEVQGNVIARDTEHIEGNVSLGDEDSDLITITGVVSSGHSSGALQVNSGLHTTGSVSVDGGLSVSNAIATANLQIVRDGWVYLDIRSSKAGEDAVIRLYDGVKGSNSEHYWSIHNDDSAGNKLDIRSNNSSKMSLTTEGHLTIGGKVGIGTTNPQGKLDVQGDIRAGNSDLYFTKTDHNHTRVGNADGYAAIKNAASHGALMILGRAGTSKGRYVRLWDYLQVNGGMDITGSVGIGTTSPASGAKLDVRGNLYVGGQAAIASNNYWHRAQSTDDNHYGYFEVRRKTSNRRGFYLGWGSPGKYVDLRLEESNALAITGGKVGIGTTNPRNPLGIRATGQSEELISFEDPSGRTKWHINQNLGGTNPGLNFVETGVADGRLFIQAGGKIGIGTTSPRYKLEVNGSAAKPGGGSWTNSSDARLKTKVEPLSGSLDKLLKLRGVSYEWKDPEEHGNLTGKQIGMIAQEVEKVFPQWVGTDSNGYKDLTFRGFEALAVEAFRELKAENEMLKLKYKELEARTESLQELIKREKEHFC